MSQNQNQKNEFAKFYKPILIVVLALTAFGAAYAVDMIRMERHLLSADKALHAENWNSVIKDADAAKSIFRNIDHDNIPVNWYLGMANFNTGDLKQSEIYYRKAIKNSPHNPIVLNNFGQLLVESGNYEEAKKVLTKALDLYQYYPEAIVNLSTCYYYLNDYRMAFKTLKKLKFRDRTPEIKNNIVALRAIRKKQFKERDSIQEQKGEISN